MLKAILIGALVIGLGVAALAVHFGVILHPAAAQPPPQVQTIFPRTAAGCERLYGGGQGTSTSRAGDPFKYVDCQVVRCHRAYAANAPGFKSCVGAAALAGSPSAGQSQPAAPATPTASSVNFPLASKTTARLQADGLASGMTAGLSSSGARGVSCQAVSVTPIEVSCGFQSQAGAPERVTATMKMISSTVARVSLKSLTATSYCIDSGGGSPAGKKATTAANAQIVSRACP